MFAMDLKNDQNVDESNISNDNSGFGSTDTVGNNLESQSTTTPDVTNNTGFTQSQSGRQDPVDISPRNNTLNNSIPNDTQNKIDIQQNNASQPTSSKPVGTVGSFVAGSDSIGQQATDTTKPMGKKRRLKKLGVVPIIIIAFIILLSVGAAAYIGVVLPNNPDSLWNKALSNSAKSLEKLAEYRESQKDVKGANFKGDFKFDSGSIVADGSFEGKTYEGNSEIKADIGAVGARINAELLTNKPESAKSPDIYIKVDGLGSLASVLGQGNPEIQSLVESVNGQWYVVDHTLIDQVAAEAGSGLGTLSPEETQKLTDTLISATNEYIISNVPEKAVLTVTEEVGKETLNDRKVYHYKVSINKDNLVKYLETLKSRIKELNIKSFENSDKTFDVAIKNVQESQDLTVPADVWVDMKTKLIRKIKLTNKDSQNQYLEVSLNYDGKSKEFPLEFKVMSDENHTKSDIKLNVTLDTGSNKTTTTLNADIEEEGTKSNVGVNFTIENNNDPVNVALPKDAKSIYELIGLFGVGTQSSDVPSVSQTLGVFDIRDL